MPSRIGLNTSNSVKLNVGLQHGHLLCMQVRFLPRAGVTTVHLTEASC